MAAAATLSKRAIPKLIQTPFNCAATRPYVTTATKQSSMSDSLDWDKFLRMRKAQRRYGMITSIPTTVAGAAIGGSYFATIEADQTQTIMGLEPVYIYGIATLACVAFGYVIGPISGTWIWKLTHRQNLAAFEKRERIFLEHIKKNRADPRGQSVNNPLPDYYGEKIGSLHQYRQWLRDQAAYKRKSPYGGKEEF